MRKSWILFLLLVSVSIRAQIQVDVNKKAQQAEGWGVSLCWWAHMCGTWSDDKIDTLVDWLVSPDGLNFNIFRYNIGGGDDPQNRNCDLHHMGKGKGIRAEMPGFKQYADSPYDWQADSAQIKILLKIREKRPDAIFEAFSNSAPWFMTKSGCVAGNKNPGEDNLREECYDDFANYLVDVCQHFKEKYGLVFRTLEPFNESHSDYWGQNGSQEGCHFDTKSQVEVIKRLYPLLKAKGLETVISASDETSTGHSLEVLDGYGDVLSLIGQWNVHTYSATHEERQLLYEKVSSHGIRLWQSESGSGGQGIVGNLRMLQRLFDDIHDLKPAAWCDWQYVEEKGDQWSMVRGDFQNQHFEKVKNYYVRQQVSRFIRRGDFFLLKENDQTLAAVSPDGSRLVLVVLNNTDEVETKTYQLPKKISKAELYITSETQNLEKEIISLESEELVVALVPHSVRTYIISL
jgi:O-glycosyl hydrolase